MSSDYLSPSERGTIGRSVTAVLGPTNTGKTHLAIERMVGHQSGLIGLPLRLLAREVYDRITSKINPSDVALITGEERIKPANPRYYVCTVEAMPRDIEVDFLAVDEIQLAADLERGHVFTNRLLSARGQSETLLLGSLTMRDVIAKLLPGSNLITRPRLSKLTYSGQKKLTRLPRRTAIVAFSANEVYEIAELIRRQRGGAAVVLGALSPRTRNAQVELYQNGDVDFLIATDAIGMGLNLNVSHVAFAATRKFDGRYHRELIPAELSQIAGRAGRYMNDGTFGVTGNVEPFETDIINQLESHEFAPTKVLQWRNSDLEFSSLDALKDSLAENPAQPNLARARMSDDMVALENVSLNPKVKSTAIAPAAVRKLWDLCQIPDYRKISTANHAEIILELYRFAMSETGQIPEDWMAKQVEFANRTDGDIDTLSNRISHIRTWTFVSNRPDLLDDPTHWQELTKNIEDRLSDALHEQLMKRFVDQRTSVLMKRLQDQDEMFAEISSDGKIFVEKHFVGKLLGFRFTPDNSADGIHGKAARNAAAKVLSKELDLRTRKVCAAKSNAFQLSRNGAIQWRDEEIAFLEASDDHLKPGISILADEHLSTGNRDKIISRLQEWIEEQVQEKLRPLVALANAKEFSGLARGIAFRLQENFGILRREDVSEELRSLDQTARSQLRKYGIRFGAFNIYFPSLLKPAANELTLILWILRYGKQYGFSLSEYPAPPKAGLTSVNMMPDIPESFYVAAGFKPCGTRAVRIDMIERLSDMIRILTSWRQKDGGQDRPPEGATGDGGFVIQPAMMSILGCSPEELGDILRFLNFRSEGRSACDMNTKGRTDQAGKHGDTFSVNSDQSPDTPTRSTLDDARNTTMKIDKAEVAAQLYTPTQEAGESQDAATQTASGTESRSTSQESGIKYTEPNQPSDSETNDEKELSRLNRQELVWRPVRRKSVQRRNNTRTRPHQEKTEKYSSRHSKGGKKKLSRGHKPGSADKSSKKTTQKQARIDPDSPFAALKQLRDDLESQNSDQR